jgi:hypothetical protein
LKSNIEKAIIKNSGRMCLSFAMRISNVLSLLFVDPPKMAYYFFSLGEGGDFHNKS